MSAVGEVWQNKTTFKTFIYLAVFPFDDASSNFDKSDENVRNMGKPSIFQYSCMVEILCLHIQCIYQLPCFNIAGMIRAYSRKLGHACDFSEKRQKKGEVIKNLGKNV